MPMHDGIQSYPQQVRMMAYNRDVTRGQAERAYQEHAICVEENSFDFEACSELWGRYQEFQKRYELEAHQVGAMYRL